MVRVGLGWKSGEGGTGVEVGVMGEWGERLERVGMGWKICEGGNGVEDW